MIGATLSHVCVRAISLATAVYETIRMIRYFKDGHRYADKLKAFACFGAYINCIMMWLALPPWPRYWKHLSGGLLRGPVKLPEREQWLCVGLMALHVAWIYSSWQLDALNGLIRRGFRLRREMSGRELYDRVAEEWTYQDKQEEIGKSN